MTKTTPFASLHPSDLGSGVDGHGLAGQFFREAAVWAEHAAGLPPAVRVLAAAHATRALAELSGVDEAAAPPWLRGLMSASRAETGSSATLAALGAFPVAGAADIENIESVWRAFVPMRRLARPAAGLMLEDSDSRLDRDAETGLNRYGVGPWPEAGMLAFSSSTANPVTPLGLCAAEAYRREMIRAVSLGKAPASGLVGAIRALLRLPDDAQTVLADSGTVACLLATEVARQGADRVLVVLIGAEETGRGIPLAATGRHPARRTGLGQTVGEGEPVTGLGAGLVLEPVAIRDSEGAPVQAAGLAARLQRRIEAASAAGRRVILHAVEGSKTGLAAPGLPVVAALLEQYRGRLSVIVDACQMRCDPALLGQYLSVGALVLVTGSKFLGGPPFCGLLLLPGSLEPGRAPLPQALAAYSRRGDWPEAWHGRGAGLSAAYPVGLRLRWRAALAEAGPVLALPAAEIACATRVFEAAVAEALAARDGFALVTPGTGTIATIAVGRSGGGWHGLAGLRRLYQGLLTERSLIGQPVALPAGPYPGGLRLAANVGLLGRLVAGESVAVRAELRQVVERLDALRRGLREDGD